MNNSKSIFNLDLFATGGRDSKLFLWDYRVGKNGNFYLMDLEVKNSEESNSI